MKKYRLDIVLISLAALFLSFTAGYFSGRSSVRGITVETDDALSLPEILGETDASSVPDRDDSLPEKPIDLNKADFYDLQRLPGIGETLAQRIIGYREETGGFHTTEELMEVYGIGEAIFAELKPYITVDR